MKKWREFPKKVYFQESKIYNFFKHLDIEPTELERLKRLYRGDSKKRQSLKEGSFKLKCVGFFWRYYLALILFVEIQQKIFHDAHILLLAIMGCLSYFDSIYLEKCGFYMWESEL